MNRGVEGLIRWLISYVLYNSLLEGYVVRVI